MKIPQLRCCRWSNKVVGVLFLFLLVAVIPREGAAQQLCHVADPQDPELNVRDSPGGSVINRLQNGRVVRIEEEKADSSGQAWAKVGGKYRGQWRDWGWVSRRHLRCINTKQLRTEKPSIAVLRAAGIVPQNVMSRRTLPVSCDEVPNGWGVTLSKELYDGYRRRGFSQTAICFGLGSIGVYFDPATGKQLTLYLTKDGPFPRPFWLPDCFKQVQIIGRGGGEISWRPIGCTLRYHPETGLPIDKPELVELTTGGAAGRGEDEDSRTTVSADRAQALTQGR